MLTTSRPQHGQICRRFCLVHESGDRLYPYAKKSRQGGRVTFVAAKPGAGNNCTSAEIQIADETELERLVLIQEYSVRCRTLNRARDGLYNVRGRSILRVERTS